MDAAPNKKPVIQDSLFHRADVSQTPLQGTFELTPRCTMDCAMCYIRMTAQEVRRMGREHSAKQWLKLAEEAKAAGMLYILLTGGEPLLHPEFQELYTELNQMGFILSINSNATLIDGKLMEWFCKYPPHRINVTLYGGSNETYARLCRYPGGYDRVTHAILAMHQAGINVKLNATISQLNVCDYQKIVEFSQSNQLPLDLVTYLYPPTRRADGRRDTYRLPPREAARVFLDAQRSIRGDAYALKNGQAFLAKLEREKLARPLRENDRTMSCRGGSSTFWVTWNGKISGCPMLDQHAPDVFQTGFAAAWKKVLEQRETFRFPPECEGCPNRFFCLSCPAAHFAETGNCETLGSYLCEYAACYIEEIKKQITEIENKANDNPAAHLSERKCK